MSLFLGDFMLKYLRGKTVMTSANGSGKSIFIERGKTWVANVKHQ